MKLRKLITLLLTGAAILLGIFILGLAALITYDRLNPAQRVTNFTNVTFSGQPDTTLHAYLAQPEGPGPFPGVILIHEFFGLNADIVAKADLLARQGYAVLAVDAYRGQTTLLVPRAIWLVLSTPQDQINADLAAAYNYFTSLEQVDAERTGAVGFCFGGTQVMNLGTQNPDLAAAVIFYGSGPITDPAELGALGQNGPVLGIFGAEDRSIPVSQVRAFEQAMDSRGIENQVSIYPGVGHAFVSTEAIQQPGAAQQAWQEMLAFLDTNLQTGS